MTLDEALQRLESISPQAARLVRKEIERGYSSEMVNDLRLAAEYLRRYCDDAWDCDQQPVDELADRLSQYADEMVSQ